MNGQQNEKYPGTGPVSAEKPPKAGKISKNAAYFRELLKDLESRFSTLPEGSAGEEARGETLKELVSLLSEAVLCPDSRERRMALYRETDAFLRENGLYETLEKDLPDNADRKKVLSIPKILEEEALVRRMEKVPECRQLIPARETAVPLVSVVIPVYNVEAYLAECLDSIAGQTLREIEIILVNDGSSDGSTEVARAYAERDPRISFCEEENAGQSAARNAGAARARGKYLYFMDSDDVLDAEALETLTKKAEEDSLDLLLFDGSSFTDVPELEHRMEHYRSYYLREYEYPGIYTGPELFLKMDEHDEYRVQPCMMLFTREFFEKEDLRFPHGFIHEDNAFAFRVFLKAKRAAHLPRVFYRRRLRPDSVMTSKTTFKNVFGYYYTYKAMQASLQEDPGAENRHAFLQELSYTVSLLRKRYRSLPREEQLSYLVLPDEDRRQFEFITEDVERVRASELQYKNRLQKADGEKKKLKDALKKAETENEALRYRNETLLKKISSVGDSREYRLGEKLLRIPKKIRGAFRKILKKLKGGRN